MLAKSVQSVRQGPWPGTSRFGCPLTSSGIPVRWCQLWVSGGTRTDDLFITRVARTASASAEPCYERHQQSGYVWPHPGSCRAIVTQLVTHRSSKYWADDLVANKLPGDLGDLVADPGKSDAISRASRTASASRRARANSCCIPSGASPGRTAPWPSYLPDGQGCWKQQRNRLDERQESDGDYVQLSASPRQTGVIGGS